jgi:hypothetical protein
MLLACADPLDWELVVSGHMAVYCGMCHPSRGKVSANHTVDPVHSVERVASVPCGGNMKCRPRHVVTS